MPPQHSPSKRKRSLTPKDSRSESEIPPTPPKSSSPDKETMPTRKGNQGVQVVRKEVEIGSPRTKVAYSFRGLHLQEVGDISKLSLGLPRQDPKKPTARVEGGGEDEISVRKRMRILEGQSDEVSGLGGRKIEIAETPSGNALKFRICIGPERMIDPVIKAVAKDVSLHNSVDPAIFKGSKGAPVLEIKGASLGRTYPSINRLTDSKSRSTPKRVSTPQLFGSAEASLEGKLAKGTVIVDEERAALTWHDDETTGHELNDSEDDGEGINGIGFRPTAAEAYARAQKRKQQMEEYKAREAMEARAKRSERRRGVEDVSLASSVDNVAERKVRFMEAENKIRKQRRK